LTFKKRLLRFIGIVDPEDEKKKPQTIKEKTIEFFKQFGYAAIAALFIITFIIQNTRIPTGSMEGTILVGDFVIVNKFIYGASSPRFIPFTEVALPFFTLPAVKEPERGDIVVFEYPGDRDLIKPAVLNLNYVKRLIGMPGDTIEIRNRIIYVNGKENHIPPYVQYAARQSTPKGIVNPDIFPPGKQWNEDNYGPLWVPKEGSAVQLTLENINEWRTTINREFGEDVVSVRNGKIFIQDKEVNSYTFKKDHYFMMGDNRNNSLDSRFWGYVPRDLVVGQAFLVLFSWDREIPFSKIFKLIASIRTDRILKLID